VNHLCVPVAGLESQTSFIFVPWNENGTRPASNVLNVGPSSRTKPPALREKDIFIVGMIILGYMGGPVAVPDVVSTSAVPI